VYKSEVILSCTASVMLYMQLFRILTLLFIIKVDNKVQ